MSGIFGILGLADTERVFAQTVGQKVIYDAIVRLLEMYNAELAQALGIFVEEETDAFKERYKLAGGGRLQRRGGQAPSGAVKAYGGYDIALPLEDFGAQMAGDDVALAYMTLQDIQRHLDTIFIQDAATVRFELLKALLNNTQRTFVDPLHGSLLVEPLANGDAVVYPPVLGSETEATDTHYLESGYAAANISDTNDPFPTMKDELEEHFGVVQGGGNLIAFINSAQRAKVGDLTDFDPIPSNYVIPGTQTPTPINLPQSVPGAVLGYHACGIWVVEWRSLPAAYMVAIDADAPAPLKVRVDPADTGLGRGLQLVAKDEQYPLESSHYRHRFGFGCGNRLNGVVMELGTGGTYTIPSGYS